MKKIKFLIPVFFFSLLLISCEDVIELDLNTGDEKYVIEAVITNRPGDAKVSLSKTKSFNATGDFIGETGAIVTISDEEGNVTRLNETTNGIYEHQLLQGVPENTYNLRIEINGQIIAASSKMPSLVRLDSVFYREITLFEGPRKLTHVLFREPAGKGNYYRFMEYKNGVYNKAINVINDDLIDGNIVNQILRPGDYSDEAAYKVGDKIKVDFLTIDPFVYRYWFSTTASTGGDGAATPVNPVTNLTGDALGYFSAHTIQQREYEVR